jgi:hypothetical protein
MRSLSHWHGTIDTINHIVYEESGRWHDMIDTISRVIYDESSHWHDTVDTINHIVYEESGHWHNTIDTVSRIESATRLFIRCMKKYCKLPVQSSWWWTIICSKHVEDNLIEVNY